MGWAVMTANTRTRSTSVPQGTIFDVKRFALHDGPGIRTSVFLKGCPLKCIWCHNPEGISSSAEIMYFHEFCTECNSCLDACLSNAIYRDDQGRLISDAKLCGLCGNCVECCVFDARHLIGRTYSVQEVIAIIERDRVFYDESAGGVTFTGGEPLYQPEFLLALLQACGERGIHRAIDTTGFVAPAILARVHRHIDLFLYDLKLMDDARHRHYTGVSNALILKNLKWLSTRGHAIVIRAPLISGINDDVGNIRRLAEFVASLTGPPQVDILPYHATGTDKYMRLGAGEKPSPLSPPSPDRIDELAALICKLDIPVTIGGQ